MKMSVRDRGQGPQVTKSYAYKAYFFLPLGKPNASTLQRETEERRLLRGNESGHAAAEGRQHVQGKAGRRR
ncbi:hypothetical protein V8C37DRAFT_397816 [Trichoderma ceciliae]